MAATVLDRGRNSPWVPCSCWVQQRSLAALLSRIFNKCPQKSNLISGNTQFVVWQKMNRPKSCSPRANGVIRPIACEGGRGRHLPGRFRRCHDPFSRKSAGRNRNIRNNSHDLFPEPVRPGAHGIDGPRRRQTECSCGSSAGRFCIPHTHRAGPAPRSRSILVHTGNNVSSRYERNLISNSGLAPK